MRQLSAESTSQGGLRLFKAGGAVFSSQIPQLVSHLAAHPPSHHLVDCFPTLGPEQPLALQVPSLRCSAGLEKVLNKYPEASSLHRCAAAGKSQSLHQL